MALTRAAQISVYDQCAAKCAGRQSLPRNYWCELSRPTGMDAVDVHNASEQSEQH